MAILIKAVSGKMAILPSLVTFMQFDTDKNGIRYLRIRFCDEKSNDLCLCYKDNELAISEWIEQIDMNQSDCIDPSQCEFEMSLDGIFEAYLKA